MSSRRLRSAVPPAGTAEASEASEVDLQPKKRLRRSATTATTAAPQNERPATRRSTRTAARVSYTETAPVAQTVPHSTPRSAGSSRSSRTIRNGNPRTDSTQKERLASLIAEHDEKVRLLYYLENVVSLVYYDDEVMKKEKSEKFTEQYATPHNLWRVYARQKTPQNPQDAPQSRRRVSARRSAVVVETDPLESLPEPVRALKREIETRFGTQPSEIVHKHENKPEHKSEPVEDPKTHTKSEHRRSADTKQLRRPPTTRHGHSRPAVKLRRNLRRSTRAAEPSEESSGSESAGSDADELPFLSDPEESAYPSVHSSDYEDTDFGVKRVILRVSAPPPIYPNADSVFRKAAPTLEQFLGSFRLLDEDVSPEEFDAYVRDRTEFVARLRKAEAQSYFFKNFNVMKLLEYTVEDGGSEAEEDGKENSGGGENVGVGVGVGVGYGGNAGSGGPSGGAVGIGSAGSSLSTGSSVSGAASVRTLRSELRRPAGVSAYRSLTHRDHLNSHAVTFARLLADERKAHVAQARKIAGMIEQHFRRLEGAKERAAKSEERQLKTLAKETAKLVKKRWVMAEKALRIMVQMRREEDEKVQGKKKLAEMLEKSSRILETQLDVARRDGSAVSESEADADAEADGRNGEGDEKLSVEELRAKYAGLEAVELGGGSDEEVSEAESEATDSGESGSGSDSSETDNSDVSDVSEESESDGEPSTLAGLFGAPTGGAVAENLPDITEFARQEAGETGDADSVLDESEDSEQSDGTTSEDSDEDSDTGTESADMEAESGKEPAEEPKKPENAEIEKPQAAPQSAEQPTDQPGGSSPPAPLLPVSEPQMLQVAPPPLLRGKLREYQQQGLNWLASLYNSNTNGILADEMGLGKTIQTISLLAYLACEKHVWGPHLIVVPTSVILNWEMELKRFAPGLKVLTYYGSPAQRKEKRRGWTKPDVWHVCITSYQLVVQDQAIFRRKKWHYMILDEAHNIKNFRSQRWQALLNFNTEHRLLLTGTPLQNNIVELWSLLYFLMPPQSFADLGVFQQWFGRPVDRLVEAGGGLDAAADADARQMVAKLHQVLRPFLLRRIKADVERQMPAKHEHVVYCRLSARQRFLYDDFMSRAQTRETLASGNFLSIINCLMQLRKVCNHPDLFEVRPVVTSLVVPSVVVAYVAQAARVARTFAVAQRLPGYAGLCSVVAGAGQVSSYVAEAECKLGSPEALLKEWRKSRGLQTAELTKVESESECGASGAAVNSAEPPKPDFSSESGHAAYLAAQAATQEAAVLETVAHVAESRRRLAPPLAPRNLVEIVRRLGPPELLTGGGTTRRGQLWRSQEALRHAVQTVSQRSRSLQSEIVAYGFVTPRAVCPDLVEQAVPNYTDIRAAADAAGWRTASDPFHTAQMQLSIAFPDKRLLQYDCGKLQVLAELLRKLQAGGHRTLIFTQMTKVLDILEQFLNIHGYRYLRLDGATRVEARQMMTERFNRDERIFAFILSTRSGGLGINLTGADTVIFYDSDWNPAMDKQCQDRCHRIGQTRDVHIYRFVSEHTIESNILRKANQKRMLDNVIIQEGDFTTDYFGKLSVRDLLRGETEEEEAEVKAEVEANGDIEMDLGAALPGAGQDLEKVLAAAEDADDAAAASVALREVEVDEADFSGKAEQPAEAAKGTQGAQEAQDGQKGQKPQDLKNGDTPQIEKSAEDLYAEEDRAYGHVDEYMIRFIRDGYYYD